MVGRYVVNLFVFLDADHVKEIWKVVKVYLIVKKVWGNECCQGNPSRSSNISILIIPGDLVRPLTMSLIFWMGIIDNECKQYHITSHHITTILVNVLLVLASKQISISTL